MQRESDRLKVTFTIVYIFDRINSTMMASFLSTSRPNSEQKEQTNKEKYAFYITVAHKFT